MLPFYETHDTAIQFGCGTEIHGPGYYRRCQCVSHMHNKLLLLNNFEFKLAKFIFFTLPQENAGASPRGGCFFFRFTWELHGRTIFACQNCIFHAILSVQKGEFPMDQHEHERLHAAGIPHEHGTEQAHGHAHTNTKAVINRLSRAIGHLESVKKMVEDGRDCSEVLIQLAAVRAALTNTGKVILKDHIEHCIVDAVEQGVRRVHILNGTIPHPIILEIFTDRGIGTMFEREKKA